MSESISLIDHIQELRKRLIVIIVFFGLFSVIGYIFSDQIISIIKLQIFPEDIGILLISGYPLEYFYAKLNTAVFLGLLLTIPIAFFEIYRFVAPALSKIEKNMVSKGLMIGTFLFYIGAAFAYFILMPVIIMFFAVMSAAAGIENLWSVNTLIGFIFATSSVMGIVFLVPIISLILVKSEIITVNDLREHRGPILVLIFIVAAIITPPDPLTQVMVGLPMVLLYEISILGARFF